MASDSSSIGAARVRREDPPLITGDAEYTDDISADDQAYMAILRSQHGHARIRGIDTAEAEAMDGVVAVFTAEDLDATGTPGSFSVSGTLPNQRGTTFSVLARGVARFTGEAVAVAVAEDRYTAHDAVDRIAVDYERLDAATDPQAALEADAPLVHDDMPDNRAFDATFGDTDAVDEAFAAAEHTVDVEMVNQRVIGNPMEPRGTLAIPSGDRLTVYNSTQTPHGDRGNISSALGIPESSVRVIAPDVGGGFGVKGGSPYAGDVLTAFCARQLDRPVKWIATRAETHEADHHGRDFYITAEAALDADGRLLGLRYETTIAIGAYLVWGKTPAGNFRTLSSGAYDVPAIAGHQVGAFTHTAPIAPYRGAGRPEIIYALERLVGQAAVELDVDPAELRRRNLIPPDAFPYETAVGVEYDSGDYERALDEALDQVGYDELRERQRALRDEDRYLGIGFATFVENTGTGPGTTESGRIEFHKSGRVTAYCGTADHGQGHGTSFAQILADRLGVPEADITIEEGDSDALRDGTGTFGSRSIAVGGSALAEAADRVIERARRVAAHHFEAAPGDIAFEDGEFYPEGAPDRGITIQEVARIVFSDEPLPDDLDAGLEAETFYDPPNNAFSFGTHVAVVEVDPAAGEIDFENYLAVDDCGVVVNPRLVEGQLHGGVAQGVGQALYEHGVYDDAGTLLSGTFLDYVIPRAEHVPEMETHETVTPCPHNPLGAKGTGESGAIAAPPAVVNAVVDALRPLGVDTVDMPVSNEAVWSAVDAD